MKQITLILLLFVMNNCNSQNRKNNPKKDTMQIFDITQYKDWKKDETFSSTDTYLKKGNQRLKILDFNDKIKVEQSDINNPLTSIYVYNKASSSLILTGKTFSACEIGVWHYYNNGKHIKETNMDNPYKFTLENVIKKMKQDLSLDLTDVSKRINITRSEHPKPLYTITVPQNPSRILRWIKVDGTTGEIISDEVKTPPNKYSPDWQSSESKK